MQSKTLDFFILSIGYRSGAIRPSLTLTALYVLASRVRLGTTRLFVVGLDPTDWEQTRHLRALRKPAALTLWEAGYEPTTHVWSDECAADAAAAALATFASAAGSTSRKRKGPSLQPTAATRPWAPPEAPAASTGKRKAAASAPRGTKALAAPTGQAGSSAQHSGDAGGGLFANLNFNIEDSSSESD